MFHIVAAPCFDPRPRTGGDAARYGEQLGQRPVSIRAPARGATLSGFVL